MVKLRDLNRECSARPVSRAVPAQVACRLLGNNTKPCPLDALCKPAGKHGVWFFYSVLASVACTALLISFWVLHITRLGWVLSLIGRVLLPPLRWAVSAVIAVYNLCVSVAEQFED